MVINDNRLLSYVRTHGYPNVTRLVPIPDNDLSQSVYSATNANVGTTVSSKYFPEWYYCPHCRRLYKLSEWEFHWNEKFKKDAKKMDSGKIPHLVIIVVMRKIKVKT